MPLLDQLQDASPLLLAGLRIFLYFLPVILGYAWWQLWLHYIRFNYIKKLQWVTLEIRLPQEIFKGPDAMEAALQGFYQTKNPNLVEKYIQGVLRPWSSIELVSLGGRIHFIAHIQKATRNVVESHLYAQYPGIEIIEIPDYTREVPYGAEGSDWELFGLEFVLTKEDSYPIKTYVDYELFSDKKEEFKVDPLTPVLEYLASIPPGHQAWIQIIIKATEARFKKSGAWFATEDWIKNSQELLDKLKFRDKEKVENFAKTALSSEEKNLIDAIERNMARIAFDAGIRGIYMAPGEQFNPGFIAGLLGALKQFNTINRNGFKPANVTSVTYPWLDPLGTRVPQKKRDLFNAYIRRSYFHAPYPRKPYVLTSEEVATLYHFPGKVAQTPTLGRIESKRSEPPANLPI